MASSLSLNLFLWVFGVIIVTFATYAIFNIRTTARQWNETILNGAQRYSALIENSTYYSMLLNRKEDVHHIIRTIALSPGVEGVRIYDKEGAIIFSAARAEIGTRVDMQAEACVSCHERGRALRYVPKGKRERIFERPDGTRILGFINPIENAPDCSRAACHAHPPEQSILGVLDVRMSMAEPDVHLTTVRRQAVFGAVLTALLAGAFAAAFIFPVVRRPVKRLIAGTRKVAGGDLQTRIEVRSRNEIGQLADSFNKMTRDLREARAEVTAWSENLESKLQEKTEQLSQTERQVAHMDKMASLGKLAATVAHELNNPLAAILNYAKLTDRTIGEGQADLPERDEIDRYLSLIQKESGRCGMIVRSLLAFARRSGAEFALHPLRGIVERSVMLVRHHMEMAGIRLEMPTVREDLSLLCDADQLQQALVALLVNAVEAMPHGGTLRLETGVRDGEIELAVADSGVGIPRDIQPLIFEPFFSTKNRTQGAGLGLAVVYGIIQRHNGSIEVESEPGRGTRFRIVVPCREVAGAGEVNAVMQDGGVPVAGVGGNRSPEEWEKLARGFLLKR